MHNCLLSISEYPTENNINNESNLLHNSYLKTQSYFIDGNNNDMNSSATVLTDLTMNLPSKNNNTLLELKNHSNQNNFTSFETTNSKNSKFLLPIIEQSASNNIEFTFDSTVSNYSQYVIKKIFTKINLFNVIKFQTNEKVQNLLNNKYNTFSTNLTNPINDDMLKLNMENKEIITPDNLLTYSGFSEEIVNYSSTNTTTISSPSLSDVIFPVSGNSITNGYFELSPPSLSTVHSQLNNTKENFNEINLTKNSINEYTTIQNLSNLNVEKNKHLIDQVNFNIIFIFNLLFQSCQIIPKTTKYVKQKTILPNNSSINTNDKSIVYSKKNFDSNFKDTNNSKTGLIKMLLEMTPNEVFLKFFTLN